MTDVCLEIDRFSHDPLLGLEFEFFVNQPAWPVIEVRVEKATVRCRGEVWEPILRVRIEEALEQLLGRGWHGGVAWT